MVIRQDRRGRRRWTYAMLAVAAAVTLGGCSNTEDPRFVTPPPNPATLIISQADGANDVSPGIPVTVEVVDGELSTVALTSNGEEVPGTFSPDRSYWRTAADLAYGTTYELTVSSLGDDQKQVDEVRSFSTVSVPQGSYWGIQSISSSGGRGFSVPLNGGTFGVGQPIIVRFSDVPDRRVAEAAVLVKTDKPVEGAWSWISESEAHWRPKEYWPAYTKVTVEANILGVRLTSPKGGRVLYGKENAKAEFSIGQSKIAKVDNNTHLMTVFFDGEPVAVPGGRGCSYDGSGNYGCVNGQQMAIRVALGQNRIYTDIKGNKLNYNTQSGVHVVTEKGNPVIMEGGGSCPSKQPGSPDCDPGWYREVVPYAVRLTDSGVYVHAADWNTGLQGNGNGSHGCVNIHPKDAEWFFGQFDKGDVVEIVNTGRDNAPNNGLTDWDVSWDQWLAGSALGPNRA